MCVFVVLIEYVTASEEEQQELLSLLEETKRMGYAKDLQISKLENDGQLMLEKSKSVIITCITIIQSHESLFLLCTIQLTS